jgi:hypothetical protein
MKAATALQSVRENIPARKMELSFLTDQLG